MSGDAPSYSELRDARRLTALRAVAQWQAGMPPVPSGGADLGTLRSLAKLGFVRRVEGDDALGDPRFALTDEGRAAIERGALAG